MASLLVTRFMEWGVDPFCLSSMTVLPPPDPAQTTQPGIDNRLRLLCLRTPGLPARDRKHDFLDTGWSFESLDLPHLKVRKLSNGKDDTGSQAQPPLVTFNLV